MNRKIKIVLMAVMIVSVCLWLPPAQAQTSQDNLGNTSMLGSKSSTKNFSLLDPSRFKLYQSYSFSYFSSGNSSGSLGIYTTTLNYQISNPLSLTLSLNYLHQPLSVFGRSDWGIKNSVLPNFQLLYRPNNGFSFMMNVITCPSSYDWGYENYRWGHRR
jgi:hypothetical protein